MAAEHNAVLLRLHLPPLLFNNIFSCHEMFDLQFGLPTSRYIMASSAYAKTNLHFEKPSDP